MTRQEIINEHMSAVEALKSSLRGEVMRRRGILLGESLQALLRALAMIETLAGDTTPVDQMSFLRILRGHIVTVMGDGFPHPIREAVARLRAIDYQPDPTPAAPRLDVVG